MDTTTYSAVACFFILLVLASVILILFEVSAFLRCRVLHNSNNVVIFNLAVADLFFVFFSNISVLYFVFRENEDCMTPASASWNVGWWLNTVTIFLVGVCVSCKVSISIQRYYGVIKPKNVIFSNYRKTRYLPIFNWLYGLLCVIPSLAGIRYISIYDGLSRDTILLSANRSEEEIIDFLSSDNFGYIFQPIYIAFLTFLVPFCLMSVFYCQIYKAIQSHSKLMDEGIAATAKLLKIEKKSNCLMLAVLVTFALIWCPFHIINIYRVTVKVKGDCKLANELSYFAVFWVLIIPSLNFGLYISTNRVFFRCIKQLLKCQQPLTTKTAALKTQERGLGLVHSTAIYPVTIRPGPNLLRRAAEEAAETTESSQRNSRPDQPVSRNSTSQNGFKQRKKSVHRLSLVMLGEYRDLYDISPGDTYVSESGKQPVAKKQKIPTLPKMGRRRVGNANRLPPLAEWSPECSHSAFSSPKKGDKKRRLTVSDFRPNRAETGVENKEFQSDNDDPILKKRDKKSPRKDREGKKSPVRKIGVANLHNFK